MAIPIWLDCDTGHDDAFAILITATHPRADFLGISTVFGNASLADTTYNTRAILRAVGREDVPVYAGAATPFCRAVAHADDIHGKTGLDGTTCLPEPLVPARDDMLAVQAMEQALRKTRPRSAWIVATGAMTNVALLLALWPDLAEHIAGVSLMGGAIGGGFAPATHAQEQKMAGRIGNWTAWAEFNIYIDPESARAVLTNPMLQGRIRMVPLDLSHQFIADAKVQGTLLHGDASDRAASRPDLRKLFVEILTFFAKTYASVFGLLEGPPLHDPLAVLLVLEPQLFDGGKAEQFTVEVVTDGPQGSSPEIRSGPSQCGRTVAKQLGREGVMIPRTLDEIALWQIVGTSLAIAEDRPIE